MEKYFKLTLDLADLEAGSSQAESCSALAAAQVETEEESGLAFPAEAVIVGCLSLVRLAEKGKNPPWPLL